MVYAKPPFGGVRQVLDYLLTGMSLSCSSYTDLAHPLEEWGEARSWQPIHREDARKL